MGAEEIDRTERINRDLMLLLLSSPYGVNYSEEP